MRMRIENIQCCVIDCSLFVYEMRKYLVII